MDAHIIPAAIQRMVFNIDMEDKIRMSKDNSSGIEAVTGDNKTCTNVCQQFN